MNHVTIIHGIHEGLTDPGWTHALGTRLELRYQAMAVETEKYAATAIPPWNVYVKNPRYAKFHANSIAAFSRAYTEKRLPGELGNVRAQLPSLKIHLLAHSNGTDIALGAVKRLARMGLQVETLILVSAAVHSDIHRSGLNELIRDGHLQRVIAYCNDDDPVIFGLQWFPGSYGSLGTRGFHRGKQPTGLRVKEYQQLEGWASNKHRYINRWFHGFNHSGVLAPENYDRTFACFERDMGLLVPA